METADPKNAVMLPTTAHIPSDAPDSTAWSLERALPAAALLCALLAAWAIQHGYRGLAHDSQLYTLQALSHLDPSLFAHDIFLRFGSQDRFTIFSPLYAAAMRWFGIENAAMVLTLISQVGFFAATAALARTLMPSRFVWLGLMFVCAMPGFYGGGNVFALVEDFATPRLAAEAFVLAGLAAFLNRRYALSAVLGLAAVALHPLMAAGGVFVALCMSPPRMRGWLIAGALLGGGALFGAMALQGMQLRFDDAWLRLLRMGTRYLFPSEWTSESWMGALVPLTTLIVGALALERSTARTICRASAIAAVVGIALSYVAGDLLRIVLVVQAQTWRWIWIASLIAILLLPLIAHSLWSRDELARATLLLLAASWLWGREVYVIEISALTLLAAVAATRSAIVLPARARRLIFLGASGLFVVAAVYHVATAMLFAKAVPNQTDVPEFLRSIRALVDNGVLLCAALLLVFTGVSTASSRSRLAGVTAVCIVALGSVMPFAVQEYLTRSYDRKTYDAFASWRARIPPSAEVLWFNFPAGSWFLLQRPSYLSNLQEASGLFSRPAAMAMKHRVDALMPFLVATETGVAWTEQKENEFDIDAHVSLAALCAAVPDLRFVVTSNDVAAHPIAAAPPAVSRKYHDLRLYRCDAPNG